jgi:hypothetical protein
MGFKFSAGCNCCCPCDQCSEYNCTTCWQFTVSGVTGTCPAVPEFNGNFLARPFDSGLSNCDWRVSHALFNPCGGGPSTSIYFISADPVNFNLLTTNLQSGSSAFALWTIRRTLWVCDGPNTLTLNPGSYASAAIGTWPSTVTLNKVVCP